MQFRLVFPSLVISDKKFRADIKKTYAIFHEEKNKGFYFSPKPFSSTITRELPTITFIRQNLFQFDHLSIGNFVDIPISVLYFSLNDELPGIPEVAKPSWAPKMYESVRMNIVKYDRHNLVPILTDFLRHILIPRFNDMIRQRQEKFNQEVVPVVTKYKFTPEIGTHLKLMGDIKMMNGSTQEARSLYSLLLNNFPMGIKSSYPSVILAQVACEIMLGDCTENTIELVLKALPYVETIQLKLLFVLVHYWISFKIGSANPELVIKFLQNSDSSSFFKIVEPFLQEQLALFHPVHHIPLELWKVKHLFDREEMKEHSLRILFNIFLLLKGSQCNETQSYILETIVTTLIHEATFMKQPKKDEKWLLADALGYLMIYRSLTRGPLIATYLALSNPDIPYQSGFIKCTTINYSMSYSLIEGPADFTGNWPYIAQKLFGSYIGDQFYSHSALRTNYVAIGDKIIFKVRVVSLSQYFAIGNVNLKIEGNAISSTVECDSTDDITFQVEITGGGQITIHGVNVLWCDKIPLYSLFSQHPLTFVSIEDAPQLNIETIKCKSEIVAGELSIIKLVIHVTNFDLKTLSMLIYDTKQTLFLINDKVEQNGDQYYFHKIKHGTDITLHFGLSCEKACELDPWIFFMYRSKSKLVRYTYFHPNVRVIENTQKNIISQYPSFSVIKDNYYFNEQIPLQIALEYKQQSRYNIIVKNKTHREITDIIIELEDNQHCIIFGMVKKVVHELHPNSSIAFEFQIINFNSSYFPHLLVQIGECRYASDLSVYLNQYHNNL